MFDGITEKDLKKRIDLRQVYPFEVINTSAFVDQPSGEWQVTIKVRDDGFIKERLIEVKRGEVKRYSSLKTLTIRLAKCGIKEITLDLSGLEGNVP